MEDLAPKRYKRKIVLVNREFQNRLIARVMIPISVIVIVMGIVFFLFVDERMQEGEYFRLLQIENLREMLMPFVIGLTLTMLVVSNLYAYLTFLYTSHRIAGPMFRFSRCFEELARGNLDFRVHLRDKDEMVELQDQFNTMLEFLNTRLRDAQDHVKHLGGRIESLTAQTYEQREKFDSRRALTELSETVATLSRELSLFQARRG
jgi:methyl-accepting chemotaxis protein